MSVPTMPPTLPPGKQEWRPPTGQPTLPPGMGPPTGPPTPPPTNFWGDTDDNPEFEDKRQEEINRRAKKRADDERKEHDRRRTQSAHAQTTSDQETAVMNIILSILGTYAGLLVVADAMPDTANVLEDKALLKAKDVDTSLANSMIRHITTTGNATNVNQG
jgi:hypothetical protein